MKQGAFKTEDVEYEAHDERNAYTATGVQYKRDENDISITTYYKYGI